MLLKKWERSDTKSLKKQWFVMLKYVWRHGKTWDQSYQVNLVFTHFVFRSKTSKEPQEKL